MNRAAPILWTLLLVAGQAAALALVRAGRIVSYQHYVLDLGDRQRVAAVAVLVLQAAVVLWGVRRHGRGLLAAWNRRVPPWLTLVAVVLLAVVSVSPSVSPRAYAAEIVFGFAIQLIALGNALCIVRSIPAAALQRWMGLADSWLGAPSQTLQPGRFLDRTAVVAAAWTFAAAVLLAIFVYERIPHVPDEIVYLLHARYFAAGQLALPPPPVPGAFDVDLMYLDGERWFSPVPPGWPALLAVGAAARVAWLVNPLLAGLAVLLTHAVLREIYPPRVARSATLLLALSPWMLFLGMSFMTHVATLVFALAAALGVARARRLARAWPALVGGLALGVVSLIRPLEGLAMALMLGVWSLSARASWWRFAPSAALVLGSIAAGALVRPYNAALTGSASTFPIMMYVNRYYAPGANELGFGANRGLGWGALDPFPGHGVLDVIVNALLNTFAINVELFGWMTGSLGLLLALLLWRRLGRPDWLMLGAVLVVAGIHSFYWFSGGPDFAARYWFLAIVPLCALTASAAHTLGDVDGDGERETQGRIGAAIAVLSLAALVTFVPWRAVDKYHHFRRMEPGMAHLVEREQMNNAIVLVRGLRHPDYHGAAIFNPIDLRGGRTVFAWDRSRAVRDSVVRAYPDRPVYIVDGPTLTGNGYTLRAGPLAPGSLAPELAPTNELEELMRRERSR